MSPLVSVCLLLYLYVAYGRSCGQVLHQYPGLTYMQENWSPSREGNVASQLVRADSDEMIKGQQKLTSEQKHAKEDLLVSPIFHSLCYDIMQ